MINPFPHRSGEFAPLYELPLRTGDYLFVSMLHVNDRTGAHLYQVRRWYRISTPFGSDLQHAAFSEVTQPCPPGAMPCVYGSFQLAIL